MFNKQPKKETKNDVLSAQLITPGRNLFNYMPTSTSSISAEDMTDMLNDARVGALLDQRVNKAMDKSFAVNGGTTAMQNAVNECLAKISHEFAYLLSGAVRNGFAVSEIVWEHTQGLWRPQRLVRHNNDLFEFDNKGTLLYTNNGVKVPAPEYKFVVHKHNADNDHVAGQSVLSRVYWPWKFKQLGMQFWLQLADRFGVPSIIALFDLETADDEEAQKRADTISREISRISSDSTAALANIKDVKVLEASGAIKDFDVLIESCNKEISFGITGQTLSSSEAQYGTRAQAEVHERTFNSLVASDLVALEHTLNETVVSWITQLNFAHKQDMPVLAFDLGNYADWETVRDAIDRGVPISSSALYGKYGLPKPTDDKDVFVQRDAKDMSDNDDSFFL